MTSQWDILYYGKLLKIFDYHVKCAHLQIHPYLFYLKLEQQLLFHAGIYNMALGTAGSPEKRAASMALYENDLAKILLYIEIPKFYA